MVDLINDRFLRQVSREPALPAAPVPSLLPESSTPAPERVCSKPQPASSAGPWDQPRLRPAKDEAVKRKASAKIGFHLHKLQPVNYRDTGLRDGLAMKSSHCFYECLTDSRFFSLAPTSGSSRPPLTPASKDSTALASSVTAHCAHTHRLTHGHTHNFKI